jgi:hypothetical protein
MLFFESLFSGKQNAGPVARSYRPRLEWFETRDLLSAGSFFAAHAFALANQAQVGAGSGDLGGCHGHADTTLTAALTGATGSGAATFTSDAADATNSLSVKLSGLTASTTYTVSSGTTSLGTITTDSSGAGTLSVSNLSPALTSGSTITVQDPSSTTALSGTLAAAASSAVTNLKATLTGTTGSGHAHFVADASSTNNRFKVSVSGLSANATYTVQVDGTTIGQLTTDSSGAGQLSATDLTQTISAGSLVTVLDSTGATVLQGTFAAASGSHGGRHH